MYDRYGVLQYVPYNAASTIRSIDANVRLGDRDTTRGELGEIESQFGSLIALNDNLLLTMDDREKQQRFDNDIVEGVSPVFDASITNRQQARRVARQILKTNSLFTGSITSILPP